MKLIPLPSYKVLFGEPEVTYEEVLSEIPSEIVLMILISINAELNTTQSHSEKNQRLWDLISYRFTKEQRTKFAEAFYKFNKLARGHYDGTLFARPYLFEMMLRELKRNRIIISYVDKPIHEYSFLIAYLLLVDELNQQAIQLVDNAKDKIEMTLTSFPLLWAGGIKQHEFNQNVNFVYEMFRLISFLKYSYEKFKPFLKELINKYKFQTISQFAGSFNEIIKGTFVENPNEPLRKLVFITPNKGVKQDHLQSQCCNLLFDNDSASIFDLRKYPLYKTQKRGYIIIDEDMYKKKIYKGPLFELHKETSLGDRMAFPDYKNDISKYCFEHIFFRSITRLMVRNKYDLIHFDELGNNKPDLYYRNNKTVMLFEFKDYLFPDSVMAGKDFDSFKKYIDERFVKSSEKKPKGINQLANNILSLYRINYDFDSFLNRIVEKNKKGITVYPVICHTDFMFGMLGINEYLNILFKRKLDELDLTSFNVKNITVISLEVLFDFSLRGNDFIALSILIKRYWEIVKGRRNRLKNGGSLNDFLSSNISFDEMYETKFKAELVNKKQIPSSEKTNQLIKMIGLSQEQLDEVL